MLVLRWYYSDLGLLSGQRELTKPSRLRERINDSVACSWWLPAILSISCLLCYRSKAETIVLVRIRLSIANSTCHPENVQSEFRFIMGTACVVLQVRCLHITQTSKFQVLFIQAKLLPSTGWEIYSVAYFRPAICHKNLFPFSNKSV